MKQTENNGMELLLRSLAKRASSISNSSNEAQHDDAHLDADELNAFAERSAPPAARARYTAHIADCLRCRKLVAALTAAAGLPITEIKTDDDAQASFWQRLPAFLSPAVLRFAVPALALLAVVTIGIISLRQQPSADFVAQHREPAAAQSDLKSAPEPTTSPGSPGVITTQSPAAPVQKSAPLANEQARPGQKAAAGDQITTVDSSSALLAKDAPRDDAKQAEEAKPTFAPEPPPVASPQATIRREADKNEAVALEKEGAAAPSVAAAPATRDERQAVADRENLSRSRKAAAAGRGDAITGSLASRGSDTKQKRADQDAELRVVAGRRFQRQGNIWVDVDYDADRSAMTVVRGSEQYRVLVADEPGIRTIAEKLAGEVIVVWKGRAYRIR